DLGVGRDELKRHGLGDHPPQADRQTVDLGVSDNPALQVAGLADIECLAARADHAVNPRRAAQILGLVPDQIAPTLQAAQRRPLPTPRNPGRISAFSLGRAVAWSAHGGAILPPPTPAKP